MKNYFVIFFVLISTVSIAQKNNVKDASTFAESGELQQAEKSINLAIDGVDDDKTINDPETWLVRGNVYKKIYQSANFSTNVLKELTEAAKSYTKAVQLADKEMEGKGKDHKLRPEIIVAIKETSDLIAKEAKSFHDRNIYESELQLLQSKIAMMKLPNALASDMQTVIDAGIAAKLLNRVDEAIAYFDEAIAAKFAKDLPYVQKAEALKMRKSYDEMMKVVKEGVNVSPATSGQLLALAIQQYMKTKNTDECETYLTEISTKYPNEAEITASLGYFYALKGNTLKANELCRKALSGSPSSYLTNYYMGWLYYEKAMQILREADAKAPDIMKVVHQPNAAVNEELKLALPLMEKAFELNPSDRDILKRLETIYRKLDMFVKSMDMKKLSEKYGYTKL